MGGSTPAFQTSFVGTHVCATEGSPTIFLVVGCDDEKDEIMLLDEGSSAVTRVGREGFEMKMATGKLITASHSRSRKVMS